MQPHVRTSVSAVDGVGERRRARDPRAAPSRPAPGGHPRNPSHRSHTHTRLASRPCLSEPAPRLLPIPASRRPRLRSVLRHPRPKCPSSKRRPHPPPPPHPSRRPLLPTPPPPP